MAKRGSADITVMFDNAAGTPVNVSQYVTDLSGIDQEATLEDTTAMGDANNTQAANGFKKNNDITLKGFYDDTATTGPNDLFNAVGNTTTRTLQIGWGNSKTSTVETVIKKYMRDPKRGMFTGYTVVLAPSGPIVEA